MKFQTFTAETHSLICTSGEKVSPKQLQDNRNVRHVVHGAHRHAVRELASLF